MTLLSLRAISTQFLRVIVTITCLLVILALPRTPVRSAHAAGSTPSLVEVTRVGHALAVSGRDWGKHVVVTARIGNAVGGAALVTAYGGRFTVGIDFAVACGGITVEARDYAGHDVAVRRAGPLCPNRTEDSGPAVVVLRGTSAHPRSLTVAATSRIQKLTLHVSEELLVTEIGYPAPLFQPMVDTHYFAVLQHGPKQSGSCALATCGPLNGQFWSWIAVKRGQTVLSLSPTCRLSHPACELPERIITIRIVT